VVRPGPCPPDRPRLRFRRGKRAPRAIAWLGARSFWGHLWHLFASVIATEDIDSRDWMEADEPSELTRRIAKEIGANEAAPTLTDALDGDLWIDFVADTGDCSSVSQAVARFLFTDYEVDDPDAPGSPLRLPRGHMLVFGGDTAYPVATDFEIHNRITVPWNRVLRGAADGRPRALLGVPGNHDWYAGLDGFGRMFRRRRGSVDRSPRVRGLGLDRYGQIGHFIEWFEAFRVGTYVGKRPALPLLGYTPVQSASYWALHLAPNLDFWGPDRQLRAIDFQQQTYFALAGGGERERGVLLCLADPVHAFLEPNPAGEGILRALGLDLREDGPLILTGDTHHYCRQRFGASQHVTAGGGGAFLHPARIHREGVTAPEAEFPGPKASLALAVQIPLQIVHGRAGFLAHVGVALLELPTFALHLAHPRANLVPPLATALTASVICFLIGGFRSGKRLRIGLLAALTGALVGLLPFALQRLVPLGLHRLGLALLDTPSLALTFALTVYIGTWIFGTFLTALTLFGLEHHQAFSSLAHPGYKHFVRLRVRRDGTRVDGWALGRVDPLSPRDRTVLIDHFTWQNPRSKP
jgi:hypothetical protein